MQESRTTQSIDHKVCERARLSRDARFDGLFFTAVRSTGIYCRPICPAPTPKVHNVEYYQNAAAAAAAGYRPCLRCRPEAAPGTPLTRARSDLVAAALKLIESDAPEARSVAALARRIGVGERHLRRMFAAEVGAGPLEVAATRRLLFAKKLLSETSLPITRVGLAAGYRSVRRFNAAFLDSYAQSPRQLRRGRADVAGGALTLRLPYRAPYDFSGLLAFFARRAIPGLESVDGESYTRRFRFGANAGSLHVTHGDGDALALSVDLLDTKYLQEVCHRVRRMFDLDADVGALNRALGKDPILRSCVRRNPGLRLPGAWDGFEVAVRAVLGQQISVAAARTLAARLLQRLGEPVNGADDARLFPTAIAMADADLDGIGITRTRADTLRTIARAVVAGDVDFRPEQSLNEFVSRWTTLAGIGEWTAHYIAMRALNNPDAFPAADLILRRAVASDGVPVSTRALEKMAEGWRPWRAYSVMHLWRSQS